MFPFGTMSSFKVITTPASLNSNKNNNIDKITSFQKSAKNIHTGIIPKNINT